MSKFDLLQIRDMLDTGDLVPVPGGFKLNISSDQYDIWVYRMLYNWRLVVGLHGADLFLEHGFCYFGTDQGTLLRAVTAGFNWDDALNTKPEGYDKEAF